MKTVFVKILSDGNIIEAPKNYKNISNFNKIPRLMIKEGFVERIKGYKKSNGEMKYIEPEKWAQHKTYYTTFPYNGEEYEWSEEKGCWQIKLEIAKQNKLNEIHRDVNSYMEIVKKGFSNAEMETWSRQENGVKLLKKDINSQENDAIWVRNLASVRGISLEEMMQRIDAAVTMMNTVAYQIVGYQQRLEDVVNSATTLDEISEICFDL